MAYTVHPDGSITTDTIDEAVALSKRLSGRQRNSSAPAAGQNATSRSEFSPELPGLKPQGWVAFQRLLNDNQKKVLHHLKTDGRLSLEEIRKALGLANNKAVTGVLSGLVKNARKANVDMDSVFVRTEGKDGIFYSPGSSLKEGTMPTAK